MTPAPRELLGQDRALHEQHRHGIGGDAGDQERGEQIDVVRDLDHECDGRKWRAHRATHHRTHAKRSPDARVRPGEPGGHQSAQRASHDHEWGEDAA